MGIIAGTLFIRPTMHQNNTGDASLYAAVYFYALVHMLFDGSEAPSGPVPPMANCSHRMLSWPMSILVLERKIRVLQPSSVVQPCIARSASIIHSLSVFICPLFRFDASSPFCSASEVLLKNGML
jgi:hypothetical protein